VEEGGTRFERGRYFTDGTRGIKPTSDGDECHNRLTPGKQLVQLLLYPVEPLFDLFHVFCEFGHF